MATETYAEVKAAMESNTVCRCNGTGQIGHDFQGGFTTELCPCRRSLPRRYGRARWWSIETVHADSIELDGLHHVGINVTCEVPISEDNYPLHRTAENSHFRVLADIDADDARMLTSDNLRELAAWLVTKADRMDELDQPYPENPHVE